MSQVFISYAREDQEFVARLYAALSAQGREVWVDWQKIPPTADWWQEICAGIESADNFIFIISPDSAESKVCQKELAHAVECRKRLIPIMLRQVPGMQVPDALTQFNWIFFQETNSFDKSFGVLTEAIDTDLEWVKKHTKLLTNAIDWNQNHRNVNLLLRGTELDGSEAWLSQSTQDGRQASELIFEYIRLSRQYAIRTRRVTTIISTVVGIVILIVSVIAYSNYRSYLKEQEQKALAQAEALQKETIVKARKLAAEARTILDSAYNTNSDPVLGALLAVESMKRSPTLEGDQALRQGLTLLPYLVSQIAHSGTVESVAISPDGQWLATASDDGVIRLLEISTGREKLKRDDGGESGAIAFSPDGQWLAIGCTDNTVRILELTTGGEIKQINHNDPVNSVAFSSNGQFLAIEGVPWGGINHIEIWDLFIGQKIEELYPDGWVSTIMFSPDSSWLAAGINDGNFNGEVWLWSLKTGDVVGKLGPNYNINDLTFSPNQAWLAVGTGDSLHDRGEVGIWQLYQNTETGQVSAENINTIEYLDAVSSVSFNPDGTWLAVAAMRYLEDQAGGQYDGIVQVWSFNKNTGKLGALVVRIVQDEVINDLEYSADGQWLAAGSGESFGEPGNSLVWLISPHGSGNVIKNLKNLYLSTSSGQVFHLAFNRDGSRIGEYGFFGLQIWDLQTGEQVTGEFEGYSGVNSLAFSKNGQWMMSSLVDGADGGEVRILDEFANEIFQVIDSPEVSYVEISPNGEWLITGNPLNRTIRVWEIESKNIAAELVIDTDMAGLGISSDGKLVAASNKENQVFVWDMVSGQKVATFPHDEQVFDIVFSAESDRLATASGFLNIISGMNIDYHSNKVQVWDLETQEIVRIEHGDPVYSVAFSPDGKWLASGTGYPFIDPGNVWFWLVDSRDLIAQACTRLPRNLSQAEWNNYFPGEPYQPTCQALPLEE